MYTFRLIAEYSCNAPALMILVDMQLRHGAISHVDAVNRIIGQLRQNRAIGGAVSSQLYS